MIDYSILPPHMRDGARLYIENGIPGGSFSTAVFSNDLMGAFRRGDDVNIASMRSWAVFLHSHAPIGCWGSPERVSDWVKAGGLNGIERAQGLAS